jgi:hypothetical protein
VEGTALRRDLGLGPRGYASGLGGCACRHGDQRGRLAQRHVGRLGTRGQEEPAEGAVGRPSRGQAATGSGATRTSVRWGGRSHTTAFSLRRELDQRGIEWEAFLASHPAVVKVFGLRPVAWNGKRVFSRAGLRPHLLRNGVRYAGWAARHPHAAGILLANDSVTT